MNSNDNIYTVFREQENSALSVAEFIHETEFVTYIMTSHFLESRGSLDIENGIHL